MNNFSFILSILFISITFFLNCQYSKQKVSSSPSFACQEEIVEIDSIAIPDGAKAIIKAYPNYVASYRDNRLIFYDSTSILFDDGRIKEEEELLSNPDINDMFKYSYPKGVSIIDFVPKNDPGRIRNEAFFKKIYGHTKEDVFANLVEIVWCPKLVGQKILVTEINDIHLKIQKISEELDGNPKYTPYIQNIGGTFNWRKIKDTDRMSTHSYGISIDLNVSKSNYWKWDVSENRKEIELNYRNQFPQEIVSIFEKYGFIWGGKWKHYDTMHFEYRPELYNTVVKVIR